jgi:WD40 repeat protein/CRP-like cAMP-binding protein
MAKQVMPEAELVSHPSDIELTAEQYAKIGLFANLQRKVSIDKFPGALKLRRFRKGEVLFRQGEQGWTAFYILTSEDVLAVGQSQIQSLVAEADASVPEVQSQPGTLQPQEIAALRKRLDQIATPGAKAQKLRAVATVHLAIAKPAAKKRGGLFGAFRSRKDGAVKTKEGESVYIPVDGPVSLSYDSMKDDLNEGEMFGEMSCLYRSPRSATVVAKRDCYMLELLRNILDQVQKDPAYKAKADEIYKQRVLRLHLRNLSIFHDLTDEQFEELRREVELVSFEPGQLICDEHDRSDCMYIVRGGLVKTMMNVSSLLTIDDVQHWPNFCVALAEGEQKAATPRGKFWQLMPADMREAVKSAADPFKTLRDERRSIVQAINNLIKDPKFAEAKEFKEVLETPAVKDRARDLPANRKEWSEIEVRRYNRFTLEALYPQMISRRARPVGPPMILSYRSRGEFIGEMGVMTREPRSATCIAHGQPNEGGVIELVKISEQTFWKLINSAPGIRAKVEAEVAARKQASQERAKTSIGDDTRQVLLSARFEELGLIQGQKLMLIDLDRCTRCDECVRGCVNTHDDGRSRLFLDGPRFGKYLVPTSCRSCLDPVCMIGCPVGSIHRGDNKQIVIEDWCIGCGLCSDQCPYGSIQMHDLGLVAEAARGWRFLPATGVADKNWNSPRYSPANWLTGRPPFLFGREFHATIGEHASQQQAAPGEQAIYFRYEFDVPGSQLGQYSQFRVEVTSADPTCLVYINGTELFTPDKPKRGKREFWIPPKPDQAPPAKPGRTAIDAGEAERLVSQQKVAPSAVAKSYLHSGRNVVAVRVSPLWMVRLNDAVTGEELLNLRGHEGAIRCMAFAADGKRLAAGASDGTVRVWNVADGKEAANFKAHQGMVTCLAFAPDGQKVVTGGEDKLVRIWALEAKGAKEAASLKGHEKLVTGVAFSSDGSRVASGSWDQNVRLWDVKTGGQVAALKHQAKVFCLVFGPDSARMAVGCDDGVVSLWDVESQSLLKQFTGHEGLVWSVSYALDARRVISGSNDGTVRVWDAVGQGTELACLRNHQGAVRSVAFAPDARRAVSGSDDKTVRIWDARAGKELSCIQGQQGKVYAVAFSPDGNRVAYCAQSFTTGDVLLDLRLDKVNRPDLPEAVQDEVTEKLVTHRAVVCDLCSTIPGQVPACVNACPHDAAMRVDARFEFPMR